MSDLLIVFTTALLSGGFAIPAGFLLELPAIATYLAACAGSIAGLVVFAFVGGGLRTWIINRMDNPEEAQQKVAGLLGKNVRFKKVSEVQAALGIAGGAPKNATQEAGISP